MNKTTYRSALKKLGLTIVGAAPILGISRRQSQRLAGGGAPVPTPVENLLRYMLKYGIEKEGTK